MKYSLLTSALILGLTLGCAHQKSKREPASISGLASAVTPLLLGDVGVVGPDGEVLLYYKEGNNIIVKNCEPLTVLGATPETAKAKCQGKSSKVPLETFKQALRNLVNTDNLNHLKPVSPDEVKEYSKSGMSEEEIAKMQAELDKIDSFILAYGKKNAPMPRREQLEKDLAYVKTRSSAIKKINGEIEKVINAVVENELTIVDSSLLDCDDKDKEAKTQFMYTVLKKFDPNSKRPCGQSGTVEQRIQDCSLQVSSTKGSYVLVTRTKDFKEIYKDTKSGLIWGDRLPNTMTHYNAQSACNDQLAEAGEIRASWRLPTKEEFEEAEKNGVRSSLPNINHWFWSSSVLDYHPSTAWLFGGDYGSLVSISRYFNVFSVRCVAR